MSDAAITPEELAALAGALPIGGGVEGQPSRWGTRTRNDTKDSKRPEEETVQYKTIEALINSLSPEQVEGLRRLLIDSLSQQVAIATQGNNNVVETLRSDSIPEPGEVADELSNFVGAPLQHAQETLSNVSRALDEREGRDTNEIPLIKITEEELGGDDAPNTRDDINAATEGGGQLFQALDEKQQRQVRQLALLANRFRGTANERVRALRNGGNSINEQVIIAALEEFIGNRPFSSTHEIREMIRSSYLHEPLRASNRLNELRNKDFPGQLYAEGDFAVGSFDGVSQQQFIDEIESIANRIEADIIGEDNVRAIRAAVERNHLYSPTGASLYREALRNGYTLPNIPNAQSRVEEWFNYLYKSGRRIGDRDEIVNLRNFLQENGNLREFRNRFRQLSEAGVMDIELNRDDLLLMEQEDAILSREQLVQEIARHTDYREDSVWRAYQNNIRRIPNYLQEQYSRGPERATLERDILNRARERAIRIGAEVVGFLHDYRTEVERVGRSDQTDASRDYAELIDRNIIPDFPDIPTSDRTPEVLLNSLRTLIEYDGANRPIMQTPWFAAALECLLGRIATNLPLGDMPEFAEGNADRHRRWAQDVWRYAEPILIILRDETDAQHPRLDNPGDYFYTRRNNRPRSFFGPERQGALDLENSIFRGLFYGPQPPSDLRNRARRLQEWL